MRLTRKQLLSALLAAAVLSGGVVAPVSADVTGIDTETSVTPNESEIQEGDTWNMTGNSSNAVTIQAETSNSTEDPVMKIGNNATSRVVTTNASAENQTLSGNPSGSHWNFTISESGVKDTEHTIGENVTVHADFYNNSSADSEDYTMQFHIEFTNNSTVEVVTDSEVDDDSDFGVTEQSEKWFGLVDAKDTSDATIEEREVDGDKTDVVVVLDNSSMADTWEEGVGDRSSESKISSVSGLFSLSGAKNVVLLTVDSTEYYVPVFYKSAPSEWDEDSTYAVYDTDYGGEEAVVLNLGESFDDAEEVDMELHGNAGSGDFTSLWGGPVKPSDLPDSGDGLLGFMTVASVPLLSIRPEDAQSEITVDADTTTLQAEA